ncbi:AAA family ATPase [Leptonema illini]|jgi:midasin (ATPase involved in ribosome maturation)|uniref:ATPase associated with various cellular activities AAA_5 n=1 Tax=Leptonema illini DSM 21528 TaxID=929563 RepID=H2CHA4_9LEPT|nr:AAA family ATPase [Leptonema illini]EHQ07977.1 ATPase associated with various cellular activities AAA_5 [Leptonema illini DSM 21528]PKL30195.1 MAG: ATPase [Spirochaetae bacterium HGW-Spirochaetae-10]
MKTIQLDGVALELTPPDSQDQNWVGNMEVLDQLLACWMKVHESDLPLSPRLIGRPGVGKTTLACAAAKALDRPYWIFQGTMDTRPEDLLISPVINAEGKIKYVASGIVTAMIEGGVAILDEGNRMGEKSWASLAPLLDHRRYVESIVAGVKIKAHPEFRFCTTMNEDASTFEIPEYIQSRLQPQIYIDFADADEEHEIIKANMPFAPDEIIAYVVSFLQNAHSHDEPFSVRDGINITRMILKLGTSRKQININGTGAVSPGLLRELLHDAVMGILGDDALRYIV